LEVGDNFEVDIEKNYNEGDVNFYIVLYTQAMHNVKKDFIDPWKTRFRIGDVVVAKRYYKKWGMIGANYMFLRRSPIVFLHASHVTAIKFPMLFSNHRVFGNDLVFTLLKYSLCGIMQALVALNENLD
jgi:hypothetical protein